MKHDTPGAYPPRQERFCRALTGEAQALTTSVDAARKSVEEALAQYQGGLTDFNRVAVLQERLVQRQEELAKAQGEIALGLVHVYRALGGGWQIRMAAPRGDESPMPELAE